MVLPCQVLAKSVEVRKEVVGSDTQASQLLENSRLGSIWQHEFCEQIASGALLAGYYVFRVVPVRICFVKGVEPREQAILPLKALVNPCWLPYDKR